MNQEQIKNVKFCLICFSLLLCFVFGIVCLESKVQKNWDEYEQKVFSEYR